MRPVVLTGSQAKSLWLVWLLGACALAPNAWAYNEKLHQQFTFLAAKQFNLCIEQLDLELPPFNPLQVRYVARANVQQAQSKFFTRMFRWNYYNREDQSSNNWLWILDTRFHDHFNEVQRRLSSPRNEAAGYRDLGRVANYVQTVTSPARAVPVYTARWWRFNTTDRFDAYPMNEMAVAAAIADSCQVLLEPASGFDEVLKTVAQTTLQAVEAPINGMPTTWSAFWEPDRKAGSFGEYGPAGNNFGRETTFRCGAKQRCVLLKDDPLYAQFALQRHIAAVVGTMRVMHLASLVEQN